MSVAKKSIGITISEEIIKDINELRNLCHENELLINRSDLIAILLMHSLEEIERDIGSVGVDGVVDGLGLCLHEYYEMYNLAVRREAGAE